MEGSGSTIGDGPSNIACGITHTDGSQISELRFPDIMEVDIWNFHFSWHTSLLKLQPIKFNVSSDELIFLEVFAGSANLSEAMRRKGLLVHAVDDKLRRQSKVSIHVLDLTRDNDVEVLLDMATHANIGSAHFALPCGTASKGRERPLPEGMESIRAEPLRSATQPLGVSGLAHLDSKRVAAANRLYALTLCVLCILVSRGASVSVENPRNSYFWIIMQMWSKQHPWMKHIWESLKDNISEACMYGSKLDKWTTIKATSQLYDSICRTCDKSHTHESWKPSMGPNGPKFPTTAQSEYPIELCNEMANCLARFLLGKGTKFVDTNLSQDTTLTSRQLRQHGRKQLPPLLAEYWMVCDMHVAQQFPFFKQLKQLPPTCEKRGVILVQHDKNFSHACKSLEEQYSGCLGTVFAATCASNEVQQWCGVLRKPEQTIQATLGVKHPMDLQIPLPDLLLRAVATVLKLGPGAVAERRAMHCSRILNRVRELEADEKVLHEGLHRHVRSVLKGKRLLIWRELMVETGYPDLEIFEEVTEGIKLVGPAHASQAFPAGMTPAQQSVGQLEAQAVWRRKTSIGKCRSSGDTAADVELWEQSLAEAEAGWIDGPFYDEREVSERVKTNDWICTSSVLVRVVFGGSFL